MQSCNVLTISLLLILSVNPSSTAISNTQVYGKTGGIIELKAPPGIPVTSIIWKHGKDKAAEWFQEDKEPPTKFGIFNTPSTSLIQDQWSLIITNLQSKFNGTYSAEVNNKDPTESVTLTVIEAVSKPDVRKNCVPESPNCALTCNGTGEGSTQYSWSWNGGERNDSDLSVLMREDQDVLYTCNFSNPVSWETNSITVPKKHEPDHLTGGIVGAVIIVVVAALVAFALAWYKGKIGPCKRISPGNISGTRYTKVPPKEDSAAKSEEDPPAVKKDEAEPPEGQTTKEQGTNQEHGENGDIPNESNTPSNPAKSEEDPPAVKKDEAEPPEGQTTKEQGTNQEHGENGDIPNESNTPSNPAAKSEEDPPAVKKDEAEPPEGQTTKEQGTNQEHGENGDIPNESNPLSNPAAKSGEHPPVVKTDEAEPPEGQTTKEQAAKSGEDLPAVKTDEAGPPEGQTTKEQANPSESPEHEGS